jgi:hypothetical protein
MDKELKILLQYYGFLPPEPKRAYIIGVGGNADSPNIRILVINLENMFEWHHFPSSRMVNPARHDRIQENLDKMLDLEQAGRQNSIEYMMYEQRIKKDLRPTVLNILENMKLTGSGDRTGTGGINRDPLAADPGKNLYWYK